MVYTIDQIIDFIKEKESKAIPDYKNLPVIKIHENGSAYITLKGPCESEFSKISPITDKMSTQFAYPNIACITPDELIDILNDIKADPHTPCKINVRCGASYSITSEKVGPVDII